ncbi:MAG: hypothetical protein EDR02_16590 [Actinobacteria bacterium]|nr:MAG: hypothetical protein EDR02_16590 [Actinomycetota bacterium]RIK08409.1 MAG: hypothetical protein DCC48_00195 [Acidobacteriota bacterium]
MGALFIGGIAGMIVSSVADNNGAALTFGLTTAVAAVCLILVTAVSNSGWLHEAGEFNEAAAADLERRIQRLVAQGASEDDVRDLVRAAVSLGRSATIRRPHTKSGHGPVE